MLHSKGFVFLALVFAWGAPHVTPAEQNDPPPQEKDTGEAADVDKALTEGFAKFVGDPNKENYLAVRKLVVAHPTYSPYSDDLRDLPGLLREGKDEELQKKAADSLPNLLLSPAFHITMSRAALRRGDQQAAVLERRTALACYKGILATGDGSEENPYLVLRTSDEYDVLGFLDKESRSQGLSVEGDRKLDVQQCTDGSLVWFDVTDAFAQLSKRFRPDPPAQEPETDP